MNFKFDNEDSSWRDFTKYLHQDALDAPEELRVALESALANMSVGERKHLLSYVENICSLSADAQWEIWCKSSASIYPEKRRIGDFIGALYEQIKSVIDRVES